MTKGFCLSWRWWLPRHVPPRARGDRFLWGVRSGKQLALKWLQQRKVKGTAEGRALPCVSCSQGRAGTRLSFLLLLSGINNSYHLIFFLPKLSWAHARGSTARGVCLGWSELLGLRKDWSECFPFLQFIASVNFDPFFTSSFPCSVQSLNGVNAVKETIHYFLLEICSEAHTSWGTCISPEVPVSCAKPPPWQPDINQERPCVWHIYQKRISKAFTNISFSLPHYCCF